VERKMGWVCSAYGRTENCTNIKFWRKYVKGANWKVRISWKLY